MAKNEKKQVQKIEREYVVPLVKAYEKPRTKRAAKAVNILRAFMKKHFHLEGSNVLVSNKVNEAVWSRGIEHVPRRIKVKTILAEGKVNVFLPYEKLPEKKEAKRREKKEEKKEKTGETAKELSEEEKAELKKKEEKKEMEKEAEKMAIKRGTK
ncbi:MAG: 50S ribosomal protein L31e [Candidatus ainarchaeum sp.]|nr:50S ribosomal protein L31e [Candidatus ainarchaeum sp.]